MIKVTRRLVIVSLIIFSLTACSSINTKDVGDSTDKVKDLNSIETEKSTSEEVKSLDEITSGEKKEELADLEPTISPYQKVEMPDGTEVELTKEAADAVLKYKELNKQIMESNYPQKRTANIKEGTAYETTVDASFKITSIVYNITKYDSEGQGVLTAHLKGTVAGLDGTYELEIPYEKAIKLKVGDAFAITYQTIRVGGNIVIVNIKY